MARRRHGQASPLDRALRELRPGFAMLVLFSCGINLLILASPLYMWQIYDRVLASGRVETLVFLTLITAAALARARRARRRARPYPRPDGSLARPASDA